MYSVSLLRYLFSRQHPCRKTCGRILHSAGTPDKGATRKRMDGFVLSIDQGTTGTTALVFDRAASVRGRGYSEFTQHYPRPGWVEHDAEEIWRVSLRAASEALATARIEAQNLCAVGITNQRETIVAWERASGRPVSRAIVWQDRRTAARWDDELLSLFGVPLESLPEVKPSSGVFGETDPSVFFGARVPVAGVAGDQQAALFGQGCFDAGMVKNTYGTGSFLLMNTGREIVP